MRRLIALCIAISFIGTMTLISVMSILDISLSGGGTASSGVNFLAWGLFLGLAVFIIAATWLTYFIMRKMGKWPTEDEMTLGDEDGDWDDSDPYWMEQSTEETGEDNIDPEKELH
ncbi:MAG: hypothetical protein FWE38_00505 [Firmicutes bacterium]|nr:hypothetical protein [Bacillota bacterium]